MVDYSPLIDDESEEPRDEMGVPIPPRTGPADNTRPPEPSTSPSGESLPHNHPLADTMSQHEPLDELPPFV